jgi:PatG C-terminal
LIEKVVKATNQFLNPPSDNDARNYLLQLLNTLYYQHRKLGNHLAGSGAKFRYNEHFSAYGDVSFDAWRGPTLDRIDVVKSPYGQIDSDCWDVELKFKDTRNLTVTELVFRFTLDVSGKLPVTLNKSGFYISPIQVRSATVQHRRHGRVNGRGKGRGQGL